MAGFVNATDAIAAAIEIERRGHAFYTGALEKAEKPKDKEFFAFMANEEKRHQDLFTDMLKRIGGLRLPAASTDQEYLDYLSAMLDHHSLFGPGREQRIIDSPLDTAMQFEKDTLLYFIEMEALVPDAEKQHLRALADEERRHLKLLGKIGQLT